MSPFEALDQKVTMNVMSLAAQELVLKFQNDPQRIPVQEVMEEVMRKLKASRTTLYSHGANQWPWARTKQDPIWMSRVSNDYQRLNFDNYLVFTPEGFEMAARQYALLYHGDKGAALVDAMLAVNTPEPALCQHVQFATRFIHGQFVLGYRTEVPQLVPVAVSEGIDKEVKLTINFKPGL